MALTRASAAVVKTEELVNNRNRIINGDMRIAQRGTASVTATSGFEFPVDRFFIIRDTATTARMAAEQSTTAPAGFVNSVKVTTTTAQAVLAATDYHRFAQNIEGFNVADLDWGTASAKTVNLSFWVRSSLTGTFGGSLGNSAWNRTYPFTYTISSADTWEYKTIIIPGDTSGTWLTNNGIGLRVDFGLGVGTTYSGTAGAWAGALYISATGATNVSGTLNATWYITGVQLEVGSVATPFERRPYGTELALCQRYCFVLNGTGDYGWGTATSSSDGFIGINLPVPPRTPPTGITATIGSAPDTLFVYNGSFSSSPITGLTFSFAGTATGRIVRLSFSGASGLTAGQPTPVASNGSTPKVIFNGMEL
jgi:hypothetical protein